MGLGLGCRLGIRCRVGVSARARCRVGVRVRVRVRAHSRRSTWCADLANRAVSGSVHVLRSLHGYHMRGSTELGQTVRSSRSEWRCMNQSSEREPRTGEPCARLKPS